MRMLSSALTLVALVCFTSLGWAEPLVALKDGAPSPGVVIEWSGAGRKVELTLKAGTDPAEVATLIETSVDGVRLVKVNAGKVVVIGLDQDTLLQALTDVDLGGDDLDILAAAAIHQDDFVTGSSIRAKKRAELQKLLKDRKTVAYGRIVAVQSADFPRTRLKVRILRAPTGKFGDKTIRRGRNVIFAPIVKMKDGRPDFEDEGTLANIGAWFLKKGDKVRIRVGEATDFGFTATAVLR